MEVRVELDRESEGIFRFGGTLSFRERQSRAQRQRRTARGARELRSAVKLVARLRGLTEPRKHQAVRIQDARGDSALDESSAQTKVVLHLNAEQAVRLVVQQQSFSRAADSYLPSSDSTSRIATLAWLARSGAMRGWSLGTSWAQETGQSAKRELFVKYQQGWARH